MNDIGNRSGYGSLQSFTRTFGAVIGIPPAQ
ncbi:helix-turn-helix domain-containing protein [Trinickia dinghuensis]